MDQFEEILGASEDKWESLMQKGHPRSFKAGEIIFVQGQDGKFLYCINFGIVKNVIFMSNGKEKIIHFLVAPAITGQSGIFDNKGNICSAVAVTDADCVVIPREEFKRFLFKNPQVMYKICMDLVQKARCTQTQSEGIYNSVPHNLARFLLDVCNYGIISEHHKPPVAYKHENIANLLGTTRQRVTQYLNEFQKQGLIDNSKGIIKILDVEGLSNYLNS
ncbi:MAG: Crp/Fnr family transcriptional regulator [Gracilibacteraceae bacterium]|jgi:CRP-like cAMP-binding protein|nr:Crp/Fnr family transcriptional regulator [Gracilibacteraceae bacterium]